MPPLAFSYSNSKDEKKITNNSGMHCQHKHHVSEPVGLLPYTQKIQQCCVKNRVHELFSYITFFTYLSIYHRNTGHTEGAHSALVTTCCRVLHTQARFSYEQVFSNDLGRVIRFSPKYAELQL